MARKTYDGNTTVWWVTDIDDPTAPREGEINAGLDLSPEINHPVALGSGGAMVENTDVTSKWDLKLPGTGKMEPKLEVIWNDDPARAVVYNTMTVPNTRGYLVIRVGVPYSATAETGDVVTVIPAETCIPEMKDTAANQRITATVPLALTDDPALNVDVLTGGS